MSIVTRWEHIVAPGKIPDYIARQRDRQAAERSAPGSEYYVVARNMGEPGRFRVLSGWTDLATARAFAGRPQRITAMEALLAVARNAGPTESYDVVHRVRGQAFVEGEPPGVVSEREWVLKSGGELAKVFIDSRKEQFELVAKESPGFVGHTLLRHRGSFHRFRVLTSHNSREDSPQWLGSRLPVDSPARIFAQAHPDSHYTDVTTHFELWEPVILS